MWSVWQHRKRTATVGTKNGAPVSATRSLVCFLLSHCRTQWEIRKFCKIHGNFPVRLLAERMAAKVCSHARWSEWKKNWKKHRKRSILPLCEVSESPVYAFYSEETNRGYSPAGSERDAKWTYSKFVPRSSCETLGIFYELCIFYDLIYPVFVRWTQNPRTGWLIFRTSWKRCFSNIFFGRASWISQTGTIFC